MKRVAGQLEKTRSIRGISGIIRCDPGRPREGETTTKWSPLLGAHCEKGEQSPFHPFISPFSYFVVDKTLARIILLLCDLCVKWHSPDLNLNIAFFLTICVSRLPKPKPVSSYAPLEIPLPLPLPYPSAYPYPYMLMQSSSNFDVCVCVC